MSVCFCPFFLKKLSKYKSKNKVSSKQNKISYFLSSISSVLIYQNLPEFQI